MKKKFLMMILCTCFTLTACGKTDATEVSENTDDFVSTAQDISFQEMAAQDSSVQKETADTDQAADKEAPVASDTSNVSDSGEKAAFDGDSIELDYSENEFVKVVSSEFQDGNDFGSFVVDLDKDGKQEAFVLAGIDDTRENPDDSRKYFAIEDIWFIDESLNATKLDTFGSVELCCEQNVMSLDGRDYMTFNGYRGIDGFGLIYTSMEDKLTDALKDAWAKGQKNFSDGEVIWNLDTNNAFISREAGVPVKDGMYNGKAVQSYPMYFDNGFFCHYGAKAITKEEAEGMTGAAMEHEEVLSAQYIYRDNFEIEVNYVTMDDYDYIFNCDIYTSNDNGNTWNLKETIPGFYCVNVGDDSDWDFLSTEME